MKLRHILRALSTPSLPPVAQVSRGLERDADFRPPEPGIFERLFGIGSDGRTYTMSVEDQRRLRPIYLKSERTLQNERIAAARAARRSSGAAPDFANFAADPPQPILGTASDAYDFMATQPDMSPEAKSILSGVQQRKWGPRHVDVPPKL
jgi:hypothetical protein